MQPECENFYEISFEENVNGCCLNCKNSSPGCLCPNCKCRKCFHYSETPERNGNCDLSILWRQRRLSGKCVQCGTKIDYVHLKDKKKKKIIGCCPHCGIITWRRKL